MKYHRVWAVLVVGLLVGAGAWHSGLARGEPKQVDVALQLAIEGTTAYSIIIANDAPEAEEYAAEELAHFLKEMTGADFPIELDSAVRSDHEIVLGTTNRLSLDDVPEQLRPEAWEGFAIIVDEPKLYIIGNIPRGTLYGVYDFLEQELGVRFLTPNYTYVPSKPTLSCRIKSRRFDPVLEYRNIGGYCPSVWAVRNRINAVWSWIPLEAKVGGVKYLSEAFVHTFNRLVPPEKYFDEHPEYFSEVGGKRIRDHTQLCLSNPEVLRITIEKVREWIEQASVPNPHTKLIISISPNDWGNHCQCAQCTAINEQEGSSMGTLMRFINKVAEAIGKDYPNVAIDTLAYARYRTPPKTRPAANVLIRYANSASNMCPLDAVHEGPGQKRNWENILKWSRMTDNLYVWNYYVNFGDFFKPWPNLRYIDENIRLYVEHGMRGLYAQNTYSPGTEMGALRSYLLAKCMWRPETDGRKTMEEFCRLYYGAAGDTVLKYIFISTADAILRRAYLEAQKTEERHRVEVVRLPIWYLILQRAFSRVGKVISLPVQWHFKTDPSDIGQNQQWFRLTSFDDWDSVRIDKSWTKQGYDYHGVAWYATDFTIDKATHLNYESLGLYFGAVDGYCDIFLDGTKVGEQKEPPTLMWDKGFYVPVAGGIKPGAHRLVVRVEKDSWAAGIWKPVLIVDMAATPSAKIRFAGRKFIEVTKRVGVTHMSEYYGPAGAQLEKDFYPKIKALLHYKPVAPSALGSVQQPAALLGMGHTGTRSIVTDETALTGSALVQLANRPWTMGQAVHCRIPVPLQKGAEVGQRYKLRAHIKTKLKGHDGVAFEFGYLYLNADFSCGICDAITVNASDVKDNIWQWYQLPTALEYRESARGQYAFVRVAHNPQNVESVHIDLFEFVPVRE